MEPLDVEDYSDETSSEASLASDVVSQDFQKVKIGSNHQAEIPSLATKEERRELMASPFHGYKYPVAAGLPLPTMWASQREADNKGKESQVQKVLETEARVSSEDPQRDTEPLPYSPIVVWSNLEAEVFILGLYIFGKDFSLLSRFLGTKTVGNVMSYYYGQFYNRDAYTRWAKYRNVKSKRCTLGELIFKGPRLSELLSRLKSEISNDDHGLLIEVFKSLSDHQTSLEEFAFALKSIVGAEAFVEVVGIGKGKQDVTEFLMDQSKPNKPDFPTDMDFSSLASEDILKFLTGGFKISKEESDKIFWEAVWPRLLAKGWHSEQPKDVRATRKCLVFLVPGIKEFSRSELTKGTHYFDSTSEILKKVMAEPSLLELEDNEIGNSSPAEKKLQELPKFTIIDTSLAVEGEEPFKVWELRNLPDMESDSSPDEQDDSFIEKQDDSTCGLKTKAIAAGVGNIFKTKKLESCSTKVMNPTKQKLVAKDSVTIDVPNEKKDVVAEVHSKITMRELKVAKERADGGAVKKSTRQGAPNVDKTSRRMKANKASFISSSNVANVASEETTQRRSASPQTEPANPRRQGTRNRPPTTRVLEAFAFGFLGRTKRKRDPKNTVADRPSR